MNLTLIVIHEFDTHSWIWHSFMNLTLTNTHSNFGISCFVQNKGRRGKESRRVTNLSSWRQDLTHSWMWRDLFECHTSHASHDSCEVRFFLHVTCDMARSHVTWRWWAWHDSFIVTSLTHVTWLVHTWHDSFTRGMIHSLTDIFHMWHDSYTCNITRSHVTWLVHMWHDAFMRVIWLIHATHCNTLQHTATHCNTLQHTLQHTETTWCIHARDMTHARDMMHSCMWHGSSICMTSPIHARDLKQTVTSAETHCSTLQHTAAHSNT